MKKIFTLSLVTTIIFSNVTIFANTQPVVDYQYANVNSFSDDRAAVTLPENPEIYGYINKTGDVVIPIERNGKDGGPGVRSHQVRNPKELPIFKDGLMVEYSYDENQINIIDKTGALVKSFSRIIEYDIYPEDLYINDFNNGLALIYTVRDPYSNKNGYLVPYTTDRYGFIDTNGEIVIPMEYQYAEDFNEGYAVVGQVLRTDTYPEESNMNHEYIDNTGFINTQGEFTQVPDIYSGFSEGLASVKGEDMYGYVDYSGNIAIPYSNYNYVHDFNEGLAEVGGPEYGYIDKKGELVIPYIYEIAGAFSDGLALVQKEFKGNGSEVEDDCQYIDQTGKVVIESKYTNEHSFNEGFAAVQDPETKLWGFINTKGEEAIPCEFEKVKEFNQGLAAVKKDGLWGLIKNPYATSLRINGKHVMTDTDSINIDGKTFVPINEIAKYFGAESVVDLENNKVELKKEKTYANNRIGETTLDTNSPKAELTTPIVVKDGVAYIYIRDLADIFGYSTSWKADTSTVVLEG